MASSEVSNCVKPMAKTHIVIWPVSSSKLPVCPVHPVRAGQNKIRTCGWAVACVIWALDRDNSISIPTFPFCAAKFRRRSFAAASYLSGRPPAELRPGWQRPYAIVILSVELSFWRLRQPLKPASVSFRMAFNLSVIPLLCAALIFFGPRASLLACAMLAILVCVCTIAFTVFGHVFAFPSGAILSCLIAYPLWSWRRQEALLAYLTAEAQRVMDEPYLPGERGAVATGVDPVQRRLTAMANMVARVGRYRRFLSEWIESLPEATLVVSTLGVVVLANAKAAKLVALGTQLRSDVIPQTGRMVTDVLMDITSSPRTTTFATDALNLLDERTRSGDAADPSAWQFVQEVEVISAHGRALLVKCAPIGATPEREAALIFHVADVTSLRRTERQRDATLRFLSHDIRSPQTSILTLVDHVRRLPEDFSDGRFIDLVERYATNALKLADDFLLLALAENQPPRLETLDLAALLADAIDDLWMHARAKHIRVLLLADPGSMVGADANLLRRTFTNLIGNAIKFSPEGSAVVVKIIPAPNAWRVSIADNGPGISEEDCRQLFSEFARFGTDRRDRGHGLGLAFVKTAVQALGGHVSVKSVVGAGSEFIVLLPEAPSPGAVVSP
jgi:signal transduction histidine kinase